MPGRMIRSGIIVSGIIRKWSFSMALATRLVALTAVSKQVATAAGVLEVAGPPGREQSIAIPPAPAGSVLRIRTQGLNGPARGSIRINDGPWVSLNNRNCTVLGIAAKLNGIGGPLNTLGFVLEKAKLSSTRSNTVSFRFDATDGTTSIYRILDIRALPKGTDLSLPWDEPEPVHDASPSTPEAIRRGKILWDSSSLIVGWNGQRIRATCSDCHPHDGRDLKYFGYSTFSIVERSKFHGLSAEEGADIAAYIRSHSVRTSGRPWNPPYQPGPGMDSRPLENWSAGAGMSAVLKSDADTFKHLFPDGKPAFDFSKTVNIRELPVFIPLPDWNEWLPSVHPLDYWGESIRPVLAYYERLRDTPLGLFNVALGDAGAAFHNWNERSGGPVGADNRKSPRYQLARASLVRWRLVRMWDALQTRGFEGAGRHLFPWKEAVNRSWPGQDAFMAAPHMSFTTETAHGTRDGSRAIYGFSSLQWYWLQLVLNDANHRRHNASPIDWDYLTAFSTSPMHFGLGGEAMIMTAITKAAEAGTGEPSNRENGFFGFNGPRLEFLDLREHPQMWSSYPKDRRDAIVEAFLAEYGRWIRKMGRDYFIKVTGELDPAQTDNSIGPPMAPPWIRSHAGMLYYLKSRKYPSQVVGEMRGIAEYLWPDSDWK